MVSQKNTGATIIMDNERYIAYQLSRQPGIYKCKYNQQ